MNSPVPSRPTPNALVRPKVCPALEADSGPRWEAEWLARSAASGDVRINVPLFALIRFPPCSARSSELGLRERRREFEPVL
jgi:hypothetical protein